jgi:pyridoxal phosphate enzyme (YggS family)
MIHKQALQDLIDFCNAKQVKLVAVSKTKPIEALREAYDAGQRIFGENKVQELEAKYNALPKDIEWHLVGHLQTNKVKYIIPYIKLIHSIDSLKLALEVELQAEKASRVVDVLLQVYIADEETKFGFDEDELWDHLEEGTLLRLKHINITGLMGIATNSDDLQQIRAEFKKLKSFFDKVKTRFFAEKNDFQTLSMGMSGDYHIAVGEGSNMIRVGSTIFGEREKKTEW